MINEWICMNSSVRMRLWIHKIAWRKRLKVWIIDLQQGKVKKWGTLRSFTSPIQPKTPVAEYLLVLLLLSQPLYSPPRMPCPKSKVIIECPWSICLSKEIGLAVCKFILLLLLQSCPSHEDMDKLVPMYSVLCSNWSYKSLL